MLFLYGVAESGGIFAELFFKALNKVGHGGITALLSNLLYRMIGLQQHLAGVSKTNVV